MSNLSPMRRMRIVLGVFLAAAMLTVVVSSTPEKSDLQTAVASALAADDPLIEVALTQYPKQGPDIIITYGQLPLFREQLRRFGPQVVPIVAAYQQSFTTTDALQLAQQAWHAFVDRLARLVARDADAPEAAEPNEEQTVPEIDAGALDRLSPEDRGLIAPLLDRLASWSKHAQRLVAPAAGPPETTGKASDPNDALAAPERDAGELDGLSPEDRGLIASLLDRLASWFESAQRLIASLLDWLASWFTPVQPPVALAADAPEITAESADPSEEQAATENHAVEMGGLSEEERGLLALFNMDQQGNAFVGQWEITPNGEASRFPSRVVMLEGPELLVGGLTALERRIFQEQEVDWQTYLEATVDIVALGSGFTLLRFAKTAGHGMHVVRDAAKIPTPGPGRALAKVLGIKAARFGLPIGLVVMMIRYPGVVIHYLCRLAESLGVPCIIVVLIVCCIVIVPLAFLLSWVLLSVRVLRFAGWLFAGAARGCRYLVVRLAMPERR